MTQKTMTEAERSILQALAQMADHYLSDERIYGPDVIDSQAMGPGEAAIQVLESYGLVTVPEMSRFAKWTDEGLQLLPYLRTNEKLHAYKQLRRYPVDPRTSR